MFRDPWEPVILSCELHRYVSICPSFRCEKMARGGWSRDNCSRGLWFYSISKVPVQPLGSSKNRFSSVHTSLKESGVIQNCYVFFPRVGTFSVFSLWGQSSVPRETTCSSIALSQVKSPWHFPCWHFFTQILQYFVSISLDVHTLEMFLLKGLPG